MIALLESDVLGPFVCHRCRLIEYLEDKIRYLEGRVLGVQAADPTQSLQLEEFSELISTSYRELVCTPKQGGGKSPEQVGRESWVTVGRNRRKGRAHRLGAAPPEVVVSNRYRPLQESEAHDPEFGGDDESQGTRKASSPKKRELLIVGDSIIRGVDSVVCSRDKESRTVCCLPGAQVGDILERVDKLLAREERDVVVMVHVGTNDIGRGRFEVLQDKFVELAEKIRSKTSAVVFSGILPVPRASRAKQNQIWRFNTWLQSFCRKEGYRFSGHWDFFWDRGRELFKRDGLHLNRRGTFALGQRMLRVAQEYLN